MKKSLMVLAAGMGSRFGGLKQMQGFGPRGETLLEYSVYDAMRSGFDHAVFVIRRSMKEDFEKHVLSRFAHKLEVTMVFQEAELSPADLELSGDVPSRQKPWGTGHALKLGMEAVPGALVVINADDFYGRGALAAGAAFLEREDRPAPFALIAYRLEHTLSHHGTVSRGVLAVNEEDELVGIREHHQIERKTEGIQYLDAKTRIKYLLGRDTLVSLNLLALTPLIREITQEAWNRFLREKAAKEGAEFGIPDVLAAAIEEGHRVAVLPTDERWMGVTHPDDSEWVREGLAKLVETGVYPKDLWI